MNKSFFLILILFTISACNESKPTTFKKDGVTIISPQGWRITEKENLYDQGYYLVIEKEGLDESGILTLTWLNLEMDLEEWATNFIDELKLHPSHKNSNLRFDSPKNDSYNGIETRVVRYTAEFANIKHEGFIRYFHYKNRTFAIATQEANDDHSKNKEGFDSLEKSFKVH